MRTVWRALAACVLSLSLFSGFVQPAYAIRTIIDSETSPVGVWTPSVGGTATYAAQVGTYTKIGKLVMVACRLSIDTIGTGSTTVISGLPYPLQTSPLAYSTAAVFVTSLSNSVVTVTGVVGAGGASTVALYSLTAAGTSMATNAVIGSGTSIYFSASYLTP